jgi:hypothetical protein
MKVQKAFSMSYDQLTILLAELKREELSISDYLMEAINRLGPPTYELRMEIVKNKSEGRTREAFFSARQSKGDEQNDRMVGEG